MATMEQTAAQIIAAVGGEGNVMSVIHCMTRLRFALKDRDIIDLEQINGIPGVMGSQWSGTQLQVIIGPKVAEAYEEICRQGNFAASAPVEENLDEGKKKLTVKELPGAFLEALTATMTPLIPYLILVGLFTALSSILGPGLLNVLPAESGTYRIFNFVATAGLNFLPVLVAVSGSARFGCTTSYALLIAAVMMYPDFQAMFTNQEAMDIFGIPVTLISYGGQVLPMFLITFVMSKVEALLKKYMPKALQNLFLPLVLMLIMLPVSFCALAPLGFLVGAGISQVLNTVYNVAGPVGTALIGGLWLPLVMTGMHLPLYLIALVGFTANGVDYSLIPIILGILFAGPSTILVHLIRSKDPQERELAASCLVAAIFGGVIEPALFGIFLKRRKLFLAEMAGAAAFGLWIGLQHVGVYMLSATNILAVLCFAGGDNPTNNLTQALIAGALAVATTLAVGLLTTRKDYDEENAKYLAEKAA